jgi:hypothetical protein
VRVQAELERSLDDLRDLLAAVGVAATELTDDLSVLAGRTATPTPHSRVRR